MRLYYRTGDLARATGQSVRTVQMFLRDKFPHHEGWWIFDERQYQALLCELSKNGYGLRRYGGVRKRPYRRLATDKN